MSTQKKPPPNPLLVRIRYSNPLPPPPFPPKLLAVKTDPARYSGYNFLAAYENEREVPVAVDGDGGMHIELGVETDGTYGQARYWQGDRSVISGDPSNLPPLDPEDQALLGDPVPSSVLGLPSANGAGTSHAAGPSTEKRRGGGADVAWLRRTEYFGDASVRPKEATPQKRVVLQPRSRDERFDIIEKTFLAADSPTSDLRHPLKPHVRATASYPLLPNTRLWSNTYQLHRFMENPSDERAAPGAVGTVGPDPRLAAAVIRPVVIRGEPRMVFYVPRDENEVAEYKRLKTELPEVDDTADDDEVMDDGFRLSLHHVRDYEIGPAYHSGDHVILVVDEGDAEAGRPGGAYYANIAQTKQLRRRRVKNVHEVRDYGEGDMFYDQYALRLGTQPDLPQYLGWKGMRRLIVNGIAEPPYDAEGEVDEEAYAANGYEQ